MFIHEFGDDNLPIILFFQGSCTHWSWYKDTINELAKEYHIIVPAVDGYEPNEYIDFISIEQTVKQVTTYLNDKGYTEIFGVYGLSFGGSMALRFLIENQVSVKNAIIDGGITPYQLPWILTRFIVLRDYLGIKLLRFSKAMIKNVFPPDRWLTHEQGDKSDYQEMQDFLQTLSNKTIWNTFDSTNNYDMPKTIPKIKTNIEYWYGSLEKKARKWDIRYINQILPHVTIKEIYDMEHGEFVMMHPKDFTKKIYTTFQR